ncbi:hypothetical protein [Micromonospora mirobrigensis]|uniref:Uncharacterized protein n=1 Tax=Micromonospora mirobrigensis TaxID=262898 RepID=A0A1C4VIT4_9ACTN|nr:hypothetical protein [Micromonospora mirobrigensis]SCE83689.1 hypothetical protein GA0070564_1011230 [Micromonospora mirobrigensis]
MFIVIGEQRADVIGPDERHVQFSHMAEVTRQAPGFVRGWWGVDQDDPGLVHVLTVLDTHEHAEAVRRMVEEHVTGVRLRLMEIDVEAEAER